MIYDVTLKDPDTRKLQWYYNQLGNSEKTWITVMMALNFGAIRFNNYKTDDVTLAYNGERIVTVLVFGNYTRIKM